MIYQHFLGPPRTAQDPPKPHKDPQDLPSLPRTSHHRNAENSEIEKAILPAKPGDPFGSHKITTIRTNDTKSKHGKIKNKVAMNTCATSETSKCVANSGTSDLCHTIA